MKRPFVQGRMDDVASSGPLCRCKDCQLEARGDITCDKQSGNAAGFKIIATDRLCLIQPGPQFLCESRVLMFAPIEEEGSAGQAAAIGKNQALKMVAIPGEAADPSLFHLDLMDGQAANLVCTQFGRPIATERDVSRPRQHFQRIVARVLAFAVSHPGPLLMLPSIAVWTMEDAAAVVFPNTRDVRQHIDLSSRQQHYFGSNAGAADQTNLEGTFDVTRINRLLGLKSDAWITLEFFPRDPSEFVGCDSIPTDEPVNGFGSGIARFSGVTEKDVAPTPPQQKSRGQTRGPGADNYYLVGFWV
jgi:hypothetical protein